MFRQYSIILLWCILIVSANNAGAELQGRLLEVDIEQEFKKIAEAGVDLKQPYKWELRFTSIMLSPLEAFSQAANYKGYWPVVLESNKSGSKYWLYLQATKQYSAATFYADLKALFDLAESYGLSGFDGFSVSAVDSAPAGN